MKTVKFVAAWFWIDPRGRFVSPVEYTIGESKTVEAEVDPTASAEDAEFVRIARMLANDPDRFPEARANLVTETGAPMLARVSSASGDNPCRISFQPDENIAWVKSLKGE
jgi:hypothetical protein